MRWSFPRSPSVSATSARSSGPYRAACCAFPLGLRIWPISRPTSARRSISSRDKAPVRWDHPSGFDRTDVDAFRGELGSTAGRRRIGKRVVTMRGERDVAEAGRLDEGAKLSFQESTGYSAGPERDVGFGILRHGFADDDVGDLQPPTAFKDAVGLGQYRRLLRAEVDHPVRDDYIDALVRD